MEPYAQMIMRWCLFLKIQGIDLNFLADKMILYCFFDSVNGFWKNILTLLTFTLAFFSGSSTITVECGHPRAYAA